MGRKIVLIGAGVGKTTLLIQSMMEKYGDDIEVMTAEEVLKSGIQPNEIENIPTMKIHSFPLANLVETKPLCGKEKRRERRSKERRNKVKR